MRFRSLGSGSSGNALIIESGSSRPTRLLVDCGLGIRQLIYRLGESGWLAEDLDAIFITHEHGDHIGCALALSLRFNIPVWMSGGTYAAIGSPDFSGLLGIARDSQPIDLGGLQLTPFTVPHDAREPLQISCTDGAAKLGVLTDLGHGTSHVMENLKDCDALMLECNHDTDMLQASPYPAFLKQRIGGSYGHLSNTAAADIARGIRHQGLKHVVAAHLSAHNNLPALAQASLAGALCCGADDIVVANPDHGSCWMTL